MFSFPSRDDEMTSDEPTHVVQRIAKLPAGKSLRHQSKVRPEFRRPDEPDADDADLQRLDRNDYVRRSRRAAAPGWKTSREAAAKADSQATIAQKSRVVETVIYATPEAASNRRSPGRRGDEVAASRLIQNCRSPIGPHGQTCNFEIRVKNPGHAPRKSPSPSNCPWNWSMTWQRWNSVERSSVPARPTAPSSAPGPRPPAR